MKLCTIARRGFTTFNSLDHSRRFYKSVTLENFTEAPLDHHRFTVKLDGVEVKTPNRNILGIPTEELGLAVADEFLVQKDFLRPTTMPTFRLARTAVDVDLNSELRRNLENILLNLFEKDKIWVRKEEVPNLCRLQNEHLSPMAEYINKLISTNVQVQKGSESPQISQGERNGLLKYLDQLNNWKLISLEYAASILKSTTLAIALMNGKIGLDDALDLSKIEENYSQTIFGGLGRDNGADEKISLMMVTVAKNFFNYSH